MRSTIRNPVPAQATNFVRIYTLARLEVGSSHHLTRGYGAAEHGPDGLFHGIALGYRIRLPGKRLSG